MTFPTHRTPDEHGPASAAGDDAPRADHDTPSAEQTAGSTAPRPWDTWEPGVRVMVRTRLPEGSSHLYTDVLGTITARTATVMTLETRTGSVDVALASVATGKIVPPAPPRRRPRDA